MRFSITGLLVVVLLLLFSTFPAQAQMITFQMLASTTGPINGSDNTLDVLQGSVMNLNLTPGVTQTFDATDAVAVAYAATPAATGTVVLPLSFMINSSTFSASQNVTFDFARSTSGSNITYSALYNTQPTTTTVTVDNNTYNVEFIGGSYSAGETTTDPNSAVIGAAPYRVSITAVPEPSSLALAGMGMLAAGVFMMGRAASRRGRNSGQSAPESESAGAV